MEFGCHTWGFTDLPLKQALGTIARMGFRYVDIGSGAHWDALAARQNPHESAHAIRTLLTRYNLQVSDVYLMLPRISMADTAQRHAEIRAFEALLPFVVALGARGVTVSAGVRGQGTPTEMAARVAEVLRHFVALASAQGLALSVEPHLDATVQTPQQTLALVQAVPALKVTLDWAYLTAQSLKPEDAAPLLPYTRHVHIRQAAPLRMQTPHEQGVLNLERVVTLLLSVGYTGVVTIESLQTVGWGGAARVDPVREALHLRDTLRHLRDTLQKRR